MSDALPTRTYPAGWASVTVFDTDYPTTSFNPHAGFGTADAGGGGRFHPFVDPAGVPVPTKYLGDHPVGAFAETLMRDDLGHRSVSLDTVRRHGIATVAFARDVVLGDLVVDVVASPTLRRLLEDGREAYPALRTVARALHVGPRDEASLARRCSSAAVACRSSGQSFRGSAAPRCRGLALESQPMLRPHPRKGRPQGLEQCSRGRLLPLRRVQPKAHRLSSNGTSRIASDSTQLSSNVSYDRISLETPPSRSTVHR